MAARAAADQHFPRCSTRPVLAGFIVEGHFARPLRRMRVAYRERLGGALCVRPTRTVLHAIADLHGPDATAVSREAGFRGGAPRGVATGHGAAGRRDRCVVAAAGG